MDETQALKQALEANQAYAARESLLEEELKRVRQQLESCSVAGAKGLTLPPGEVVAGATSVAIRRPKKDMGLQTMVAPWSGELGSIPVEDFLNGLELVAESGNWEDSDKSLVARMRLRGQAAAFLASRRDLKGVDTPYVTIREALRARFQDTTRPEDYLLKLHSMEQKSGENAKAFADRCRDMGERATDTGCPREEIAVARKHMGKVVLATYINGLKGEVGKLLRIFPPSTMEEAITRATIMETEQSKTAHPRSCFLETAGDRVTSDEGEVEELIRTPLPENNIRILQQDQCFRCGGRGHRARACGTPARGAGRDNPGVGRGQPGCYRCGQLGHFARGCPHPDQIRGRPPAPPAHPNGGYPQGMAVGQPPRAHGPQRQGLYPAPNGNGPRNPPPQGQ